MISWKYYCDAPKTKRRTIYSHLLKISNAFMDIWVKKLLNIVLPPSIFLVSNKQGRFDHDDDDDHTRQRTTVKILSDEESTINTLQS